MMYKFILGKILKTTRFGKVTINFIWKFKFWSDLVKKEVETRFNEGNVMST
jgi:hypothetical protein